MYSWLKRERLSGRTGRRNAMRRSIVDNRRKSVPTDVRRPFCYRQIRPHAQVGREFRTQAAVSRQWSPWAEKIEIHSVSFRWPFSKIEIIQRMNAAWVVCETSRYNNNVYILWVMRGRGRRPEVVVNFAPRVRGVRRRSGSLKNRPSNKYVGKYSQRSSKWLKMSGGMPTHLYYCYITPSLFLYLIFVFYFKQFN